MKLILFVCGLAILFLFGFWGWLKYGRLSEPLRVNQIRIDGQAVEVEIADTMLSRERGLSGRTELRLGQGMLFVFPTASKHGFWMKEMKIPLDILWIAGNKVIGVTSQVQPQPGAPLWKLTLYYPPEPADKVLEVPAGAAALHSWKAGSVFELPGPEVQ